MQNWFDILNHDPFSMHAFERLKEWGQAQHPTEPVPIV